MLVENGSYPAVGGLNFFRAPLFPMFMAGIWSITGESVFAVKIVQAILHAITTLMIFRTAKLLSGKTLVAYNCRIAVRGESVFSVSGGGDTD